MRLRHPGFTLVEFLVVIAIIAVVATLTIIILDGSKGTARDARRLSDIGQLQLALKLYYNDVGLYPTAITPGAALRNGDHIYIPRIPQNPRPWTDGNCPNNDYVYAQLENGKRYSLSFCLGSDADALSVGPKLATRNGILECPDGYIGIPGSATLGTNDFCVMKFEAKCVEQETPTEGLTDPATAAGGFDNGSATCDDSRRPASLASGVPITNISRDDAKTYCENIGAHLITNAEWMTIARNAEQAAANWSGGSVGNGYLYGATATAIEQDTYDQTSVSVQHDNAYQLQSGNYIWRFGNGVGEWIDETPVCGSGTGNYYAIGARIEWTDSNLDDYERAVAGPSDDTWDDDQKVGGYVGCSLEEAGYIRGWTAGAPATGLYAMDIHFSPATESQYIGFRCAK